ncbi:hypothetical protein P168DRAFT_316379 [Aspergillus campestris IBT 28561]|uniref:Uncharacterized protein n=1 Tax=Aspergillus campestris (strain IBT 28561) TaxID=1392248 RepID=A0A2I1D934_ASPC2|nr:uncharacterized protein P168DRAFT_316379 [Aspergillus campestris IBT 28561]PKY06368.1 hypothetical protein P168DRAFT_316379 [Aspergillus campestris IBT 28561]
MCISTNYGASPLASAIPADIPNYHSHGLTEPVMNSSSTLYFCCQCNDGPKLYNIQPQLLMSVF